MKTIQLLLACAGLMIFTACDKADMVVPETDLAIDWRVNNPHVTGDVEILWRGRGDGSSERMENQIGDKRAFVELETFPATNKNGPKGHFTLRIMDGDDLERQLAANVIGAFVDPDLAKAWFLAEVYFDTKPCNAHGGPGEGGHDDGSCSGADGHDDGCSDDDGHDDDGCSGDDGHDGGTGGQGGSASNGQRCRVGQIVAVKVHDGGTPGRQGDVISWKWFRADAHNLPEISDVHHWPHLCKKEVLNGNLVVH